MAVQRWIRWYMMHILAQTSGGPADAIAGIFLMFWCCGISMGLAHLAMFITALVQILSRIPMPTEAKILWCLVVWILPLLGPILWWSIGSKQHPNRPG